MKMTFSWESAAGTISPHCTSEAGNKNDINLLSCLLMDDGGIPYLQSIPWIQKGIEKIDLVLSGQIVSSSWDREAWGVLMTIGGARIYSLHDEDYFENLTLQQFKNALVSWRYFIESKPNFGGQKDIELQVVPNKVDFGKYSTAIDNKVTVVQKNDGVPDWIQESFLDSNYRTVVTNEDITVWCVNTIPDT